MTRDFDSVGPMPFAADFRVQDKVVLKDPIEAALSSIEETLSMLRAADKPPLPPGDVRRVGKLVEEPIDAGLNKQSSRAAIYASAFAAIRARVGACWWLA
jgi:hypothetical protein